MSRSDTPANVGSMDGLGPVPALLACPFCGRAPLSVWRAVNPMAACQTDKCIARLLPVILLDDADSVAAWNARPDAGSDVGPSLDARRLDWLQAHDGQFHNIDRITAVFGVGFNRQGSLRHAIDAEMTERPDLGPNVKLSGQGGATDV